MVDNLFHFLLLLRFFLRYKHHSRPLHNKYIIRKSPPKKKNGRKLCLKREEKDSEMPKKLHNSLHDYLSKIKMHSNLQFSAKILSACKHPKTQSFAMDRDQIRVKKDGGGGGGGATLADVDKFLFQNFKSMYFHGDEEETRREEEEDDDDDDDPPQTLREDPKVVDAVGSSSTSTSTNSNDVRGAVPLPHESIAVLTRSWQPGTDFRRSMKEMVEGRLQESGTVDWDFMEELLLCYLELNDKRCHKFILSAFVDLIVGLRRDGGRVSVRTVKSQTTGWTGRELRWNSKRGNVKVP